MAGRAVNDTARPSHWPFLRRFRLFLSACSSAGAAPRYTAGVTTQKTYRAAFGITNDAARDVELQRLKDALHTIEAIQAICKRHGASARVFEAGTGRVVGDITRDGVRVPGWGE